VTVVKTSAVALLLFLVGLAGCSGQADAPEAVGAGTRTMQTPAETVIPSAPSPEAEPEDALAHESPVPGRPIAPPIPSSEPEVRVSVGQKATLQGVDVTVTDVFFEPCLGEYMQAGPGMTYLFADVTMTNRAYPGTANYGSLDWLLTDAQGETYNSLLSLPCREPADAEDGDFLNQGITVRFRMAYEIPGSARGLTLQWDGISSPDEVARVLIDVGE
jgi:hypothetical protein